MNSAPNQLKRGKRPVQQQIRVFKAGEILSGLGSTTRDLFILQKGRVGVYKETSEGEVELEVIEKGGLIGEMYLIGGFPQAEKVKAIDDVEATVITQQEFQYVFKFIPLWFQCIIKVVVNRIHAASKRADQSSLRDKTQGLVSLILLLLPVHKKGSADNITIDYDLIISEGFFISRLRKKETQKILEKLSKKGILQIESESRSESRAVLIKDIEVLHLYNEYLLLKSQKKSFMECSLSDESVAFLDDIGSVAQKYGQQTEKGALLMKSALLEELSEEKTDLLEKTLLDLDREKLIKIIPSDTNTVILFKKEVLSRIKNIKQWLPFFELEVS